MRALCTLTWRQALRLCMCRHERWHSPIFTVNLLTWLRIIQLSMTSSGSAHSQDLGVALGGDRLLQRQKLLQLYAADAQRHILVFNLHQLECEIHCSVRVHLIITPQQERKLAECPQVMHLALLPIPFASQIGTQDCASEIYAEHGQGMCRGVCAHAIIWC